MTNNSEIRFYVDTMIVETLLSNEGLSKKADSSGMISSLIDSVKNYVGSHIDPDDKTGSVLNILAPGAISVMFSALGVGWLGVLLGMAMKVFNVDVKGIISTIYGKVKSALTSGQPLNSSQVDGMVNAAVQQHAGTDDAPVTATLRDAKLIKLAMISYDEELTGGIKKSAAYGSKNKVVSILGMVLGWIFKVSLASAGLMVAGDVVNKVLNRPNALDGTLQKGKPVEQSGESEPTVISKQTKFPIKAGYSDTRYNLSGANWIEKVSNSQSGIENMIISFAKDVYEGLDGLDDVIKSSPLFKATVDNIAWYNHTAAGDPVVFIPKYFTSKKQLVDHFIDDVASRAGQAPSATPAPGGSKPPTMIVPPNTPRGQLA